METFETGVDSAIRIVIHYLLLQGMSERPKFSISPDELTPCDSKQASAEMDPQASRFRVAKVDFSSTPSPGVESNDLPHFKITDELGHDIQAQKTFGRNTLETLPHIDHYRNLLSTTGVIKSRPTLLELHDLEVAVSFFGARMLLLKNIIRIMFS